MHRHFWIGLRDHLCRDKILGDLIAQVPCDESGALPQLLNHKLKVISNLGVMNYVTSKVIAKGRNGNCETLVYARNEVGEATARALVDAIEGKVVYVCGGIPVVIRSFPAKHDKSYRKVKGLSPPEVFAKDLIEGNAQLVKKYKTYLIPNVTKDVFDDRTINNIIANCSDVIGVIPKSEKGSTNSGTTIRYSALLVCHKNVTTCTRTTAFYADLLKKTVHNLFPIDVSDDDPTDGFQTVQSKKSSKQGTNKKTHMDIRSSIQAINQARIMDRPEGKVYVSLHGRGGRRGDKVCLDWEGPEGARYAWIGVSGAYVKGFESEAEAWERFQLSVPGVDSFEKLRQYHMSIPHTETNLSPTWSPHDGEIRHAAGSIGYTYTEHDDDEMALARMAATLRVTGSEDGAINRREYYTPFVLDTVQENDETAEQTDHQEADDTEQQQDNRDNDGTGDAAMDSNEADYDDIPNSQDNDTGFFNPNEETASDPTDEPTRTPQKKRTVDPQASLPTKSPLPIGPHHYKAVFPLPPIGATLVDACNFLNEFRPGFGRMSELQTQLCNCELFPGYICAVVECGHEDNLNRLLEFFKDAKFLGKYVIEAGAITCNLNTSLFDMNVISNDHMEFMAREPLVQHVKRQISIRYEDEFLQTLAQCMTAEQVIEQYMANWRLASMDDQKASAVAFVPDKAIMKELEMQDKQFQKMRRSFIPGDSELDVPAGFFDEMSYF